MRRDESAEKSVNTLRFNRVSEDYFTQSQYSVSGNKNDKQGIGSSSVLVKPTNIEVDIRTIKNMYEDLENSKGKDLIVSINDNESRTVFKKKPQDYTLNSYRGVRSKKSQDKND